MNIEDVFYAVHNLGVREALRKFQPKYSLLIVSPDANVITINKYKTVPEFSDIGLLLKKYIGCGALVASAEMYPTKDELNDRVLSLATKLSNKTTIIKSNKPGLIGSTYHGKTKGK